jgi:hypothetical protein
MCNKTYTTSKYVVVINNDNNNKINLEETVPDKRENNAKDRGWGWEHFPTSGPDDGRNE